MARVWLTAVHGSIAFSTDALNRHQLQAWSYTTFAAQAAAQARTTDTTSDLYFSEMAGHLNQYGWKTVDQGRIDLHYDTGNPTSLLDLIQRSVAALSSVDPEELALLVRILRSLAAPTAALQAFLSAWWSRARVSAEQAEFAIGPLRVVRGRPDTALIYYSLRLEALSAAFPSLLFMPVHSAAAFDLKARHVHLQLDMGAYDRIKEQLIAAVGEQVKEYVTSTPLEL